MHDCDLMIAVGARFDDRITVGWTLSRPVRKNPHDIDPSSMNKNVKADLGIVGDCAHGSKTWCGCGAPAPWFPTRRRCRRGGADRQVAREEFACLPQLQRNHKPQYAIEPLFAQAKDRDTYITTEVGQHQMWAAQFYGFQEPNRWMTSGGLGTMGYGLPAAVGVGRTPGLARCRHRRRGVSADDHAGNVDRGQYDLPIKIFILNNKYMGMVRQWQELLHGGRYSHSYSEALPDFVKLAEAYHAHGIRCEHPGDLDEKISEMLEVKKPVVRLRGRSGGKLFPDNFVGPRPQ